MAKIDRLGWAAGLAFVTYGAHIGIRVNDPAVVARLLPYLPPGWKPAASPVVDYLCSLWVGGSARPGLRHFHLLHGNAALVARTLVLEDVCDVLESLLHFSVALAARRRLFVHAGVVGWHGRAIVIPGRSMSGKTTVVEALVRAGATYYSDEYAVFDRHGRVHPYPKPLSIREKPGAPPRKCPVEELGGRTGARPLPVGLIAVAAYSPGAKWRPRVLSPGQAVVALLDNTILARIRPDIALPTLQRAALGATTLRGKRGEVQEVAEALLHGLEEQPRPLPQVAQCHL